MMNECVYLTPRSVSVADEIATLVGTNHTHQNL